MGTPPPSSLQHGHLDLRQALALRDRVLGADTCTPAPQGEAAGRKAG